MLNEIRGKATDEKTVRDRTDARSCKLSTVLKYAVKNTLAVSYSSLLAKTPSKKIDKPKKLS